MSYFAVDCPECHHRFNVEHEAPVSGGSVADSAALAKRLVDAYNDLDDASFNAAIDELRTSALATRAEKKLHVADGAEDQTAFVCPHCKHAWRYCAECGRGDGLLPAAST